MSIDDQALGYQQILYKEFGSSCVLVRAEPVSGGCINNGVMLGTSQGSYFLKWNSDDVADMFDKEFQGLKILREQRVIPIPEPYFTGNIPGVSYLILEYVESGRRSPDFWRNFGEKLASLHKISTDHFGLDHNNYIGSLPQLNEWHEGWIDFLIEKRLLPQLKIGQRNGFISNKLMNQFNEFFKKLSELIPNESASLLHGDLWSGNVITGADGFVCLIDPAVYYGNREIEIAFTRLFGGFDREFYDQYNELLPLGSGFEHRIDIHNLYPLLVHVNLFGTSYLSGIVRTLNKYIS